MDRNKYICALFVTLVFFSQVNLSIAQDSTKSKSSEEFIALKKGNFAFYLEFGSLLFKTGSTISYDNDYEWLLTAKYHLSEKTALRISGGSILGRSSGVGNNYYIGTYDTLSPWSSSTSFNTTINIQHFLSLKSKVKPFISLGIYAKYNYNANTDKGLWRRTEQWGIGPYASFGAEFFVLDNISFIGEYILKATFGKSYEKSIRYNEQYFTDYYYRYSTDYRLDLNTFKAGLSIYF